MSRRTLLSSEQRARLFGIPTDAADMAKNYVLSANNLARDQVALHRNRNKATKLTPIKAM
jgi:hypothetical protein